MTTAAVGKVGKSTPAHGVTFNEAFRVWTRVALLSFGGPAAQIAVMHRILVDEKHGFPRADFCTRSTIACCCRVPRQSNSQFISVGLCTGPRGVSSQAHCSSCRASSRLWR